MRNGKDLINKVAQELAASATTTATVTGQAESLPTDDASIDAINQVFMLFRVNYHNQYYAAYSDIGFLNRAKKLWLESLRKYSPEQILSAAKEAIEQSEYVPTLHRMLQFCQSQAQEESGLPDAHAAYVEACRAPDPKSQYAWSHPAVYFAGRETDWFFLATVTEAQAFPVFKRNYETLCKKVINGGELVVPVQPALPENSQQALSWDEQLQQLQKLREETGV